MSIILDGTSGVTTPGVVNTADETIATTLSVTGATNLAVSSGNVGIGTSSPGAKFAVGTSTDQVQAGISVATSIIYLGGPNNTSGGQATLSYNRANGLTSIGPSVVGGSLGTAVNIDVSGNVGIGTASPGTKLGVNGDITALSAGSSYINLKTAYTTAYVGWNDSTSTLAMWNALSGNVTFATNNTERMRINSTGNLLFNSGYGSVATAYGCRAWVNFNGTGSGTFAGGASTVTRIAASTTATITTTTAHELITGNSVWALTGVVAGSYIVTVLTTTTFTITTVATTVLTAASITFAVNSIRGSGNVSSITDNGVGDYTVNFTTAMVDANYSCVLGGQALATGGHQATDNTSLVIYNGATVLTTSVRVNTQNGNTNSGGDYVALHVAIFR